MEKMRSAKKCVIEYFGKDCRKIKIKGDMFVFLQKKQ